MRKAILITTALIAVLALSVGALAYPAMVGTNSLFAAHSASPATVPHPKTGDDNSTGNRTSENETQDNETAPVPPPPGANETENDTDMGMVNITVDHNVTVVHAGNVTYVNGTIMVMNGTQTLVDISFQIVAHDNGTANVTINATQVDGSTTVTVHGLAVYSPEDRSVEVFGVAKATQNGFAQWMRPFEFEVPSSSACDGSPS